MKCYVLLIHDGQHGSYPDNTYAKHLGHDLQKLLKLRVFRRICGQNGGLVVPRQTHSVRGCLPVPAAWG